MVANLEDQIESSWPREAWQDHRVLVAVSGGADSVALVCALTAISPARPPQLIVAHFNHRWRGQESDDDARFVDELARKLGLDCECGQADTQHRARQRKQTEEAARQRRYAFLQQVAEKRGARYVVTAHTADDQAETVLHRILRGTGIGGLAGIPRVRVLSPAVTLVRPLLNVRRHQIQDYLSAIGQDFREDTSNRDARFTRNRIRQELIPALETDYNPDVTGALLRLSELAKEHQQFLSGHVRNTCEPCILAETDTRIVIDIRPLADTPPFVIREFFVSIWKRKHWPRQAMGLAEWQAIYDIARQDHDAKIVLPGNVSGTQKDGVVTLEWKGVLR